MIPRQGSSTRDCWFIDSLASGRVINFLMLKIGVMRASLQGRGWSRTGERRGELVSLVPRLCSVTTSHLFFSLSPMAETIAEIIY